MPKIAIVGAGAAGCFCALNLSRMLDSAEISVFEAGRRPLAKVAVTGGGRCNLTNTFEEYRDNLAGAYPRGEYLMRRALGIFSPVDTMEWWKREGVELTVQADNCVFPKSQNAMQIVHTLEEGMRRAGVEVKCQSPVSGIKALLEDYDYVVLTAGGKSRDSLVSLLAGLGVDVTPTVPSLFTLKIQDRQLRSLMGAVVGAAELSIPGTALRSSGPLLITDWGVSGPATLKLSSYAARYLAENNYRVPLRINWLGCRETEALDWLEPYIQGGKQLSSVHPEALSGRVWRHIMDRAALREDIRCSELGRKGLARLGSTLTSDIYETDGRAAFKEEFVTCGGVDLHSVNIKTLEARKVPGLYFAGEVLDVDAITGGFNLQAAWSTAMVVARDIAGKYAENPTTKK